LPLSAICLQKNYHRSSEMVGPIDVGAFGEQAAQTKLARLAKIVSVTYASVESICRELITFLSAFMYTCIQVALPIRENLPVLSAPVNAWNAGKAFALSGPMALHIGSILTTPVGYCTSKADTQGVHPRKVKLMKPQDSQDTNAELSMVLVR